MAEKQKNIAMEISKFHEAQKRQKESKAQQETETDLDNYMENLCNDSMQLDKTEIRKLRVSILLELITCQ